MKILFLSKDLSFNGGGERMLVNLANRLCEYHDITILSLDFSKHVSIFEINPAIKILNANISRRKINFFTKFDYIRYIKNSSLITNEFDCVIGVGIICNLVLSITASYFKGECVAWEHFCYDGTPLYQKILRKIYFKNLDKVIILTKKDLPKYKKLSKNVDVIYNFTEMKFRKESENQNTFLFIGRLSNQKGIKYLLKILKLYYSKNGQYSFKIIGSGPYKNKLENFIEKHGLQKKVTIELVSNDVQTELEKSACLVMTSVAEGLPMVLIEALMCHIPAISFDTVTGPSDIIEDKKTGIIVPCYNVQLFTEKLLSFDRKTFNFENQIKKFAADVIVDKWLEILGVSSEA